MGYQPRAGSSRDFGGGSGTSRRQKAKIKAKSKRQKRQSAGIFETEEKRSPTSEELADRTLGALHNLGNQKFGLPPFSQHIRRWLLNLQEVLSEFESSSGITVDDQFVSERSHIISNLEIDIKESRQDAASVSETLRNLSDSRILLKSIEKEYAATMNEIQERKNREINVLSRSVEDIKEEQVRITRMKTGLFWGISKKAKAEKEADATQRLTLAENKLAKATENLAAEERETRNEYERKKKAVNDQIQNNKAQIDNEEIDISLERRRAACEALMKSVNSLLTRKGLQNP